ncbi:MAG: hypothetical protein IKZ71_02580 [Bacteroidales bacterium]|nr:hypothetical protein [Bacteroidales bacterium]
MESNVKSEKRRCLNCGTVLSGRSDKLFCCGRCKNEWHNHITITEKRRRERVFGALWRNYKILQMMMDAEQKSPEIQALGEMGFRDEYVTGFRKRRNGRHEYRCFDITYNKTEARLYNLRRAPEFV